MTNHCENCGEVVIGRTDKKFCDGACRSEYNNKRYQQTTHMTKHIDAHLKKNHRILKECLKTAARIHLFELLAKGFNLCYITQIRNTDEGQVFFCYDIGYLPAENNYFALIPSVELEPKDEGFSGLYHHSLWRRRRSDR